MTVILEKMAVVLAFLIGSLIPMVGIGFGVLVHKIAGYVADWLLNDFNGSRCYEGCKCRCCEPLK